MIQENQKLQHGKEPMTMQQFQEKIFWLIMPVVGIFLLAVIVLHFGDIIIYHGFAVFF